MNAHWAQASGRGPERVRGDFPHGARTRGQRNFEIESPACPAEWVWSDLRDKATPTARFTVLPAKGQKGLVSLRVGGG